MSRASNERYGSVQVMRAVAAFMVMLFHVTEGHWGIGAAGVDIFFVISGFIMGTIGLGEKPAEFVIKRGIRIIPLYWLITIAMCVASLIPGLFSSFTFDAARLLKSLFFIPYADASGHMWPLVVVGWTLNYEVFFYLVFALGLWLKRPLILCAAVLIGLGLAGFFVPRSSEALRFYFNPLLLEFLAGLILSQGLSRLPGWLGPVMLAAGIAAFAVVASTVPDVGILRAVLWGIPALLVVSGIILTEKKVVWPPALKPIEYIGDCSFSLYIIHPVLAELAHKVLGESLWVNILIIVVALIGCVISYTIIEKPSAHFLRGLLLKRKERPSPVQ